MSSEHRAPEEPNYRLSARVTPPRDPAAYRITDHFRYRMNHRQNPSIDGDTVRRCFEAGQIKHTEAANRFIFELDLGYRYRVVVALRDEAFLREEEKHRALTVYAVDEDHEVEAGWQP